MFRRILDWLLPQQAENDDIVVVALSTPVDLSAKNINTTHTATHELGGGFYLDIVAVYLRDVIEGGPNSYTLRAYTYDNANRMDMISLDLPDDNISMREIKDAARLAILKHRRLNRILDEMGNS